MPQDIINPIQKGKKMRNRIFVGKLLAIVLIVGLLTAANTMAAEETLTGTIEMGDQGVVLAADDGEIYLIQGQDLSEMVGRVVKVTGTLEEGQYDKILTVSKVEEIKD